MSLFIINNLEKRVGVLEIELHQSNDMLDEFLFQFILDDVNTGGSRLSQIFWEHEILSGLSVIWLIYIKFYKEKEKKSGKKSRLSRNPA